LADDFLHPDIGLCDMSEFTEILEAAQKGDRNAAEELLPLVYNELRRMAGHKLSRELPGQTIQATVLVHDAWMSLAGPENALWASRRHFFASAAEAMRRLLVDNARRKKSLKRGSGQPKLDLDRVEVAIDTDENHLIAVNDALDRLADEQPAAAELVKLRFFIGLSQKEAATLLDISERTAKRYWAFARARLYEEIKEMFDQQ
jgi:RNA polymerase sigma factor (TIGR02999 family)